MLILFSCGIQTGRQHFTRNDEHRFLDLAKEVAMTERCAFLAFCTELQHHIDIELDMRDETTIQAWRMQDGDKFCFFGSLTFVRCCWNPFLDVVGFPWMLVRR